MWRNASYKTYSYIKSTNIWIWKILGQIKIHKNPTQSVPKFKWSMHRLIFTEKYINMGQNLRHYTVTVHSKIAHLTTAVKVELHMSCLYDHQLSGSLSSCDWKVFVCSYKYDCSCITPQQFSQFHYKQLQAVILKEQLVRAGKWATNCDIQFFRGI